MSNIQNLKPWKPGQSGNPGGRPKKKLIDEALEELLATNDSALAFLIASKLVARAKRGDIRAIQLVMERVQGKPKAKMELSGPDGRELLSQMSLEEIDAEINRITNELGLVKKEDLREAAPSPAP